MEEIEKRKVFGTTREQRKQIEIEESLESLTTYLDDWVKIPVVGWRFGLDALIGMVPAVGDTITSGASFYILFAGVRYGVPKITLARMAFNLGLDYVVGAIPFVGDAFDFFWKANRRNMNLIKERGTGKGQGTTGDYVFVFGIIALLILILLASIAVSVYILSVLIEGLYNLGRT